jgi:hypothetical protein
MLLVIILAKFKSRTRYAKGRNLPEHTLKLKIMKNYTENSNAIAGILSSYFNGVFNGDTALLIKIFHPKAVVAGDVNGVPYFKTLDEYLEGVGSRKSPHELNETFRMEIISIEIINSIAIAKVHLPIFDFNYYDLLSLTQTDRGWVIVNKLLTNVKIY